LDQYHPLLVFIRSQDKLIGAINLFRSRSQKPFNNHEQTLLLRLMPYVNHAFQNQNAHDLQYVNQGVSGMVLMDKAGNILYQNATAERLLLIASYPLVPMDSIIKINVLLSKLRQLCRNLNTLFEGKDAAPPSFCHTNGRGRFLFTAYWLDKANREPGGLIGVTIEHQEPQALIILRALRDLPLSPVQKEVALLVAQGVAYENIGERLHIKLTTVKDHVYKIFDKLDIHHREELLPKLLAKKKENLMR
jgi:DNA-binding CsgD family transcriptional regulator